MTARRVVPILIVTGFLGSGKTTLLSHWLRAPALRGATAIINEFGAIGIDDALVHSSTETVLLENGCACCTAGEDLAATLERLFWEQLRREIAPISMIVIETTGVAMPQPILDMIELHPLLSMRYDVIGVVTVLDAKHGPSQAAEHDEGRHQLEGASLVVLSKTDQAATAELGTARALAETLATGAVVLQSRKDDLLTIDAVLASLPAARRPSREPGHGGAEHHHAASLTTAFVELPAPVDRSVLVQACQAIKVRYARALVRLKGIVTTIGADPMSIQLDLDGTVDFVPLSSGARLPRMGITIIAHHVPASSIAEAIRGILLVEHVSSMGEAPDLADRASRGPDTIDSARLR